LQQVKKHIAIFFIFLLGILIPKETWHLFTNHTDTHCEFESGTNVSAEHTHCDMLQFETSSYEGATENFSCKKIIFIQNYSIPHVEKYIAIPNCETYLRGPPKT